MGQTISIKDRIKLFQERSKITIAEIERACGMSKSSFAKSSTMNSEAVANLLVSYPDLSAEWLMRGEGEMIKLPQATNVNNFDLSNHHNTNASGVNSSVQTNDSNKELIELLKQQNDSQAAQIATLTKLVETLAKK